MPYRVHRADLERATNVLTLAMMDYPVFAYIMPKATNRQHRLRHVLRFILEASCREGEVVASSKEIEAVAIWLRSDDKRSLPTLGLLASLAALPFKLGLTTMYRFVRLTRAKHTQRTKILKGRYCLLDMLGVEPRQQSRGHGRLLIEHKLEEVDQQRLQCYLETSDAGNIDYYARFGFELIHQYAIEALPVYCLLRPARGG